MYLYCWKLWLWPSLLLSVMYILSCKILYWSTQYFLIQLCILCNLREIAANLEQAYFLTCGFCACQEPWRCFLRWNNGVSLGFCVYVLSRVWLFATPWTVAHQAPLSMGFSRQEYWSGLPFPSPGDLPNPGTEARLSCVSCTGRQILYHCATWEAPWLL